MRSEFGGKEFTTSKWLSDRNPYDTIRWFLIIVLNMYIKILIIPICPNFRKKSPLPGACLSFQVR